MAFPVDLPPGAYLHLPVLIEEIRQNWAGVPYPSVLAAQVEQESRWKEKATLNMPANHELGVGLGQFTKTNKFDAITEMKDKYPKALAGWGWKNPYDVQYQARALVLKNRDNYTAIKWTTKDEYQKMAMVDASYNGGSGGLQKRRTICMKTKGCDPGIWFGHLEFTSAQNRKPSNGYKRSFADITNEHVYNVMVLRRAKYLFMDSKESK